MPKYVLQSGLFSRKEGDNKTRKVYKPGDIVEGNFEGNKKFKLLEDAEKESAEVSPGTGGFDSPKSKGGRKKKESVEDD